MDLNRRPFQPQACPENDPGAQSAMITETLSDSETSENSVKLDRKMSVFDAYAKIGSELKHTLKAFENNNYFLTNKLTKLQQEVATLKKKRDHQKTTLIDLQIKAEKLDQRKQLAVEEFYKEKQKNLKILNKEFLEVSENDEYISETHEKIKHLLAHDKETVLGAFVAEVNREYDHQTKTSKEYQQASKKSFLECWEKIKCSIDDEKKVDVELDEAVQKCKNHTGLKEKYEYELQEKYSNLKLIENEANCLKIKIKNCKESLEEMSRENAKLAEELVKTVQVNSVELRKKDENIEKLKQEIEEKVQDLSEKEGKLNEVTEEHKFLTGQIRLFEKQVETIVADTGDLNVQIGELNKNIEEGKAKVKELEESIFKMSGIHQIEKDVSTRKNTLMEKVAAKTAVVTELDQKSASLEEKWVSTKSKLENLKSSEREMTTRNENAKKELEDMLNGLKEARESTKLKKMERELSELNAKSLTLREQIRETEDKLETAAKEISSLGMENAALETEFQEVNERDCRASGKMIHLDEERHKLAVLKKRIADVRENVKSIRASKEFNVNIELLREHVKKVEQEIEDKKNDQDSQKEVIESSFKKTMSNLQEQIDKLKDFSEEEVRRRQVKIDRFTNGIPPLQEEISGNQQQIVQTTEKNIEMMKERLQMTGRLIERYKALQSRSQTSEGRTDFTVMRMLGTIEEHLASSFRGMLDYLRMAPVDMSRPSYAMYRRTLNAFEERFVDMTSPANLLLSDPDYLEELKNAAFCLFGLRRYSETIAGSDSTFFSPTPSNFHDL